MKMKMLSRALTALASLALIFSCSGQVEDKNENVYSYRIAVDTVEEGEDIPVHLYFSDAGLSTDNKSWGNPWEKAYFHATVKDSFGETVENTLWSSPAGVIGDGSRLDIGESGRLDLVLASLRQGEYTIDMNIETRYTVDTWATASFRVLEDRTGRKGILVDGISLPNEKDGMDVDAGGNIILDLAVYNSSRPYKYACRVTPDNATDKRLAASSASTSVVTASIEGETTLVLVPKAVGQTTVLVRSLDGGASETLGVTVVRTSPTTTGFSLPTDKGEKETGSGFDVAGRLALDINDFNEGNPYEYTCRGLPSGTPRLTATSSDEDIVKAGIRNNNVLILTPKGVGYATVTVSTTDGRTVRTLRVAVISAMTLTIRAEEDAPSDNDRSLGIFPCKLVMTSDSNVYPDGLQIRTYCKGTGRVDLTDPADYFKVDSLKNSRSAVWAFEEESANWFINDGKSAYDIYKRVFQKVADKTVRVHHADDFWNAHDYDAHYRLYDIVLDFQCDETYDANLYRVTINREYDKPGNRIYQYLH